MFTYKNPFSLEENIPDHFWLSGTNFGAEVSTGFYWSATGSPMEFTDWSAGQPDNSGNNEHCLQWHQPAGDRRYWNDLNCDIKLRFICELVDSV